MIKKIETIFLSQFAYRCDLGDENLVDFLNTWNKKGNGWFDWSLDLYFDKVFHVNSVLVKRIGEYVYSNPDIYLDYRIESKLLYVFMKRGKRRSFSITSESKKFSIKGGYVVPGVIRP